MTVVVDPTVAMQWVVQEEDTGRVLVLWDRWQESGELVVAPPLFKSEVCNILHWMVTQDKLSLLDAADIVSVLESAVAIISPPGLYERAIVLASELKISSFNDAVYIMLAEIENCAMWTADRRLYWSVKGRVNNVYSVGSINFQDEYVRRG